MVMTEILAEYRNDNKTVLVERIRGREVYGYRVTVAERFTSLTTAKAAFLEEIPPSQHPAALKLLSQKKKR